MGRLNIVLTDATEKALRDKIGNGRGRLSTAIETAIKLWLKKV